MKKLFIRIIFLSLIPVSIQADIYRFQDSDGRIYYSLEKKSDSYTRIIKTDPEAKKLTAPKHRSKKEGKSHINEEITSIAPEAPDNRPPIERYHGNSRYAVEICRLRFEMAMVSAKKSHFDNFTNCLPEQKAKVKESFKTALETVNNDKAKEALKNYHVVVMSALESIWAGKDELKTSYKQRQQSIEDKIIEAWERFEIER